MPEWESRLPPEPEGNLIIWRYMDFTQFVSLLENESLWFSRLDQFEDPFEGALPDANISTFDIRYKKHDLQIEGYKKYVEFTKSLKKMIYSNCWHQNDRESAAMWKLYLEGPLGVAIKSTVDDLRDSIDPSAPVKHIREVEYIDYETEVVPEGSLFTTAFIKRKSFNHENEIRAVYGNFDPVKMDVDSNRYEESENYKLTKLTGLKESDFGELPEGEPIDVDLDRLINEIHVSPTADEWFADLVSNVSSKYNQQFKITESHLDQLPYDVE